MSRDLKPSGVAWMPAIPADWSIVRAKYLLRKLARPLPPEAPALICSNKGQVVVRTEQNSGLVTDDDNAFQGVAPGDLLIHGMDTWHGAIAVSELEGKCTRVVHVCDSDQDKRFLCYYYQALAHQGVYKLISNGIRQNTSDFRSFAKFGDIPTVVPPIEEQAVIARYLDSQCGAIEHAAAAISHEIEELERFKESIVQHAVTKGLSPSDMKASGIGWVGDVPAHWDIVPNYVPLTNHVSIVGDRVDQFTLLSLTKQGIIARDLEGGGKFPSAFDSYKVVQPNQLVLCLFDIDETPRTVGLATQAGMITGAYDVFDVDASICDPRFAYYYYLAVDNGKHLRPFYASLRKTVTPTAFRHLKMPLPPLEEQSAIADYLDGQCRAIDKVIEARQTQLARLDAYKKALIYACVTGKKEVLA